MIKSTSVRIVAGLLLLACVFFTGYVKAQTKTKTATPVTKQVSGQKAKPVSKPSQQAVKTDKLFKLDGVTIIRGKVLKVSNDSVTYSTIATPKIKRVIAATELSKIVYADGSVKIIEVPEAVAEVREETAKKAAGEETITEKPQIAPPVADEIVLKTGETIQGRITSQQKFKVGYKSLENPDSASEQFVTISKIWKLRYGANGQEVVLNPVKEKPEKIKKEKVVAEKKEKVVREKPVKPERTESVGSAERLYRPFKVDITTGYSKLVDDDTDIVFGFNFSIEPKYNITDHIAAGLKIEAGAFIFGDTDEGVSGVLMMRSYSLTGEYLVGTRKVRPYFGMAVGLYQPVLYSTIDDDSYTTHLDSQIGFAPRAGIHLGHFRLGAEFNFVKDGKLDINYSYLSIKAGATIGGGKKRR